jgi:predicted regulator of Ras-like GTPase activity (Roadblock/LC7/MglB family)
MTDLHSASLDGGSRSERLDRAIHALLAQTPEIEAAAVVSFDGLPMAAALPPSMDEDRVAAMSAALLSLGERAAQGLGRGELSQVYIEGDAGTVFLVSCDDEAVLVAVASKGAKVGMMLYEVRRTAAAVADVLRAEDEPSSPEPEVAAVPAQPEPVAEHVPPVQPVHAEPAYSPPSYAAPAYAAPATTPPAETTWSSYAPSGSAGSVMPGLPPSTWS